MRKVNRLILAQEVELLPIKNLEGGMIQVRWTPPTRLHGMYRVYLNGKLMAITQEPWFNTVPQDVSNWQVVVEYNDIQA